MFNVLNITELLDTFNHTQKLVIEAVRFRL